MKHGSYSAKRHLGKKTKVVRMIQRNEGKIVEKCQGLPLAVVAIARIMSLKRKTETEWKHVYEKLSWEFTNIPSLDSV